MTPPRSALTTLKIAALAAPLFLIAACGSDPAPTFAPAAKPTTQGEETELRVPAPRALVAHATGLSLIDVTTGKTLDEVERAGFLRLNNAGDGQHVMVSDGNQFLVYDTGLHSSAHGDHFHHYASAPALTDTVWPAQEAGHVVTHNGFTTLFSDGTGQITSIDSAHVADPDAAVVKHRTEAAHHGVAVELADGSVLTTQGTAEHRDTVEVLKDDKSVARTTDCPGVHGEATAKPSANGADVVVLGCENGPVVWRDGKFHKIAAQGYQRNGNLAGHPESDIVLGDLKTDGAAAKAERTEHPTSIALINTTTDKLQRVELGSTYWFRSLARGPEGEALVLTADGSLRVIDANTGAKVATVPAIAAWQEPDDWQQPGPVLKVAGEQAFISDPVANELVVIDLHTHQVTDRHPIPEGTAELAVTTGLGATHTH